MSLIPLTFDDLQIILPWRNASMVRRAMYNHHEISLDEHLAWYDQLKDDTTKQWYLFRDECGELQGVVYFTEINMDQHTASWGFYTRPEAPQGSGLRMLFDALKWGFDEMGLHKLSAEVLNTNLRSLDLHKSVGFIEEGRFREQHLDGYERVDVIRLGLLAREWPAHREKIKAELPSLPI